MPYFGRSRKNSATSDNNEAPEIPTAPELEKILNIPDNKSNDKKEEKLSPEPTKPGAQQFEIQFESTYEEPNMIKDVINKLTNNDQVQSLTLANKIINDKIESTANNVDNTSTEFKEFIKTQKLENETAKFEREQDRKTLEAALKALAQATSTMKDITDHANIEKNIAESDYDTHNNEQHTINRTTEKVLRGLKKGTFTKNQIFEHPKYVKSAVKKSKKKRYFDQYSSSDTDSDFSQSIDVDYIKSQTEESQKKEEEVMDKGKIAEIIDEISNSRYLPTSISEAINLPLNDGTVRAERVKRKIMVLDSCITGNVTELGLTNFLKQFPYRSFLSYSQQEYNLILHKFIGNDLRKKCASQLILPQQLSTASYLTELNRIHHSEMIDESTVEQKLHTYQPIEDDIVNIFHEINAIIDLMPNSNWTEEEKTKKLFFTMKRILPPTMALNFSQLESQDYKTGKTVYPPRQQQKFYFCKSAIHINDELKRKNRYNKPRINEINHNPKTKTATPTTTTQQGETLLSNQQPQKSAPLFTYPPPNMEVLNEITATIKQIQGQLPKRCKHCNRIGHSDNSCFFHPDLEKSYQNQKQKNARCMMCSNTNHQAKYCEIYKNITPTLIACKHCKEKQIFNYHPENTCQTKN